MRRPASVGVGATGGSPPSGLSFCDPPSASRPTVHRTLPGQSGHSQRDSGSWRDPNLVMAAAASSWVVSLVLWLTGAVRGSFALFLAALLTAGIFAGKTAATARYEKSPLRALRAGVVVGMALFVPVIFDPHTIDTFNLPKYTLTVMGALVLGGLWLAELMFGGSAARLRTGLQWPMLAVVIWTAISSLTSVDVHVSFLGNYGSYDGFYALLAFTVVSLAASEALRTTDIRPLLRTLVFAGGGVILVYGLIQLRPTQWDFVKWHTTSFANDIFSTLGNPNHLGGFLAIILPIALVETIRSRRWGTRLLGAVFCAVVLIELLRTAARGAWVAALAALAALAICLLPELRRKPLLLGSAGVGVVGVIAAVMAVIGRRLLHEPLSQLFTSGGESPVEQRFQIWNAALHIAEHHPITGTGPDTFALVYPRHESAAWVATLGSNYVVNGAHNVLMNTLADQGFVGLLLFLVLLLFAFARSTGAWRRLRQVELRSAPSTEPAVRARGSRFTLAAVSAALLAYVVQGLFDVQQIALSFVFWLLLGLLALLTTAVGVPNTLSLRRLVGTSVQEESDDGRGKETMRLPVWAGALASAALAVAVIFVGIGADGPYRADHAYWAAEAPLGSGAAGSHVIGNAYFTNVKDAIALNPWESSYPAGEAATLLAVAPKITNNKLLLSVMIDSQHMYERAVADEPLAGAYQFGLAQVDENLARLQKRSGVSDLHQALQAAEHAVTDAPRDAQYVALVNQLRAAQSQG